MHLRSHGIPQIAHEEPLTLPSLTLQNKWFSRRPHYYLWVALALLAVAETLGVVGSIYYIKSVQASSVSSATSVALTSARALEKLLDEQQAPILFLAAAIAMVSGLGGLGDEQQAPILFLAVAIAMVSGVRRARR